VSSVVAFAAEIFISPAKKKFVVVRQCDEAQILRLSDPADLTRTIFRGISSRACGPCKTAPAAITSEKNHCAAPPETWAAAAYSRAATG